MSRHLSYILSILALFVIVPHRIAFAQQGLISGWVVEVQNDSDQPMTDVPVTLDDGNGPKTIGTTGSDGIVTVPFGGTTIADGTAMDIEVIRTGGTHRINITPAGHASDDCEQAKENEDDDCNSIGGYLVWGHPGRYVVNTSGTVMMTPEPKTMVESPSDGTMGGNKSLCFEAGGHFGRNFDAEETFFGVDGRAYLRSLPYPIAVDAIFSYYPMNEFSNGWAASFFGSWVFDAAPKVEVSAGPGLEFFHQSYDFSGEGSSNTSTGIGARVEGKYQLTDTISPVVDAKLIHYDGGSEFGLKFGARVKINC